MVDTEDIGIIAGVAGDIMLQFIPFAVAGAYALGEQLEKNRFWADYYKNTGHRPKYPFSRGVYSGYQSFAFASFGVGRSGTSYIRKTSYNVGRRYRSYKNYRRYH